MKIETLDDLILQLIEIQKEHGNLPIISYDPIVNEPYLGKEFYVIDSKEVEEIEGTIIKENEKFLLIS